MKRYLVLVLLVGIQGKIISASWLDGLKSWFGYSSEEEKGQERRQALVKELQSFPDQEKAIIRSTILDDSRKLTIVQAIYRSIKEDDFNKFIQIISRFSYRDRIMYLFQFGIPGTKFGKGTTPLHIAAYFQRPLFLEYFLILLRSAPLFENKIQWINAEINQMTALDFLERSIYSMSQKNERNNKICMNLLESNGALHGYLYNQALKQEGTAATLNFIDMELN